MTNPPFPVTNHPANPPLSPLITPLPPPTLQHHPPSTTPVHRPYSHPSSTTPSPPPAIQPRIHHQPTAPHLLTSTSHLQRKTALPRTHAMMACRPILRLIHRCLNCPTYTHHPAPAVCIPTKQGRRPRARRPANWRPSEAPSALGVGSFTGGDRGGQLGTRQWMRVVDAAQAASTLPPAGGAV